MMMTRSEEYSYRARSIQQFKNEFERITTQVLKGDYANRERLLWLANKMRAYSCDHIGYYNKEIEKILIELCDEYAERNNCDLRLEAIW